MRIFTQLLISTSLLLACSNIIAEQANYKGYKGEVAPPLQPVTIPTFKGGFQITLAALYLQPTSDNLAYVSAEHSVAIGSETHNSFSTESINPDYDFGFLLGIGYVIPNTANDVQLNWMHFKDADSANKQFVTPNSGTKVINTVPALGEVIVAFAPAGGGVTLADPGDFANAHGEVSNEFNAIDLNFGQYIDITPRLQTRLFAGLRYAEVERDLISSYHGETHVSSVLNIHNSSVDTDSTFNGIGPLFGMTANYLVGYGFGITGGIDAALLVGDIALNQTLQIRTGVSSPSITRDTYDFDNTQLIAPAFDAKLGVDYVYVMNNGMEFKIELGYLVSKYFDVIETAEVSSTDPIETVNFGLNGPYLSVKAIL